MRAVDVNEAAIVLYDEDGRDVAAKLFAAAMVNAGQVCLAAKRIYAPRALYDALCEELAKLAREAVVDDGLNQGAQIGQIGRASCRERVCPYVSTSVVAGSFKKNNHTDEE